MSKKATTKKPRKRSASTKVGKPALDPEELIVKIYFDVPKGLNNKQLAACLGISVSAHCELKAKSNEYNEAVKHYMNVSTVEVMQSFKKIAVGYTYDEVKQERRLNKQLGKYEMVTTEIVTKYVAPNPTAGIFWLKNKKPEEFKDRVETVHSAGDGLENIQIVIKGRDKK